VAETDCPRVLAANAPAAIRGPTCYEAFVFDNNNIEAIWQTERAAVSRR
jgi:hypothetical protein